MAPVPLPTSPLPRLLRTESRRTHLSFLAPAVPSFVLSRAFEDGLGSSFTIVVLWYGLYLLAYSAVTTATFVRDFDGACRERIARNPSWWRRLLEMPGRTRNAVAWSAFALAAAAVLAALGVSGRSVLMAVGTVVLVVGAWVNVLVSYAAEYARTHCASGGLEFPGEPPRGFGDYVYFAAAVSTTFGPTDVAVVSRAVRRQVLVHGLVAFVFNTVILALLISTLLG
ncbi:DUF1345 domain-containing protein [Kineococcus sp. SYSU DK001]|uniref:DUF1345 domain-containing protein n=1 Tax=Kineococcus sp. SYSU DK001 TaxID=3383122 RepID=UPI003D7C741E